jgi:hypothetical protein
LRAGSQPGFPASDLDLALAVDTFDFAMPIQRQNGQQGDDLSVVAAT